MSGLKKILAAGVFLYIFAAGAASLYQQESQTQLSARIKLQAVLEYSNLHLGLLELKRHNLIIFPFKKISIFLKPAQPFPAASLIKLPIMAVCFQAAKEGRISLSEEMILKTRYKTAGSGILKNMPVGKKITISKLITLMITLSDNTAANMIITKLGREYINKKFKEIGLKQTALNRSIMDLSARKKGIENYTSIQDMVSLLKRIYHKTLINKEYSQAMLDILLKQKVNDRIPKYLPKNIRIAHKTGLEKHIVADIGIVFAPDCDYILAAAVAGKTTYKKAKEIIAKISLAAYEYFQ